MASHIAGEYEIPVALNQAYEDTFVYIEMSRNESVITNPNLCYGFGAIQPSRRQPTQTGTAISSQDTEIINHPTISSKGNNTQEYLMIIDEPTADNIEPQLQPNPSYCVTRSSKNEEGGDLNLLNEGTESTILQAKNTKENNNRTEILICSS